MHLKNCLRQGVWKIIGAWHNRVVLWESIYDLLTRKCYSGKCCSSSCFINCEICLAEVKTIYLSILKHVIKYFCICSFWYCYTTRLLCIMASPFNGELRSSWTKRSSGIIFLSGKESRVFSSSSLNSVHTFVMHVMSACHFNLSW